MEGPAEIAEASKDHRHGSLPLVSTCCLDVKNRNATAADEILLPESISVLREDGRRGVERVTE